jgi:hypothetical protein
MPTVTALEHHGSARDNRQDIGCATYRMHLPSELYYASSSDVTHLVLDRFLDLRTLVTTWNGYPPTGDPLSKHCPPQSRMLTNSPVIS